MSAPTHSLPLVRKQAEPPLFSPLTLCLIFHFISPTNKARRRALFPFNYMPVISFIR